MPASGLFVKLCLTDRVFDPNGRLIMSDSIDETAGTPARLLCVLGGLHQRSGCCVSWKGFTREVIAVQTFIAVQMFLFHAKTKIGRIRADFYCRTDFFVLH